jgi:membrane-bound lytic murein transglycosylase MltF
MAAQGYQESRLNESARSPSGAIGIMQVMPATGKQLKVGDITKTEPNIHAGVKYMRFMIDRYYANEPMSDLDKALFAFASYNAGPARVAQLRRQAAQRGLDPNVWFHNVEYVAEEKVGPETVSYVGNIYKYYVAYRLIEDALAERRRQIESTGAGVRR